jgi:predicted esterase
MQRLVRVVPLLIATALIPSCAHPAPSPTPTAAPAPTATIDLLEPGDEIGGYLVTTGSPESVTYQWQLDSTKSESGKETLVNVDWGTNLNVSAGVFDETFKGNLEGLWSTATYELYIEGRPVDLAAFGTMDYPHPVAGTMRHWNVVIVADKPGQFTVHDLGVVGGKSYEGRTTFTVLPPATPGTRCLQPKASKLAGLDYLIYLPEDYGKDPERQWPLILYLHGILSKGSDLSLIAREPLPKQLNTQPDFPAIVVMPQGDGENEIWSERRMITSLMALLDETQSVYAVDTNRVYLTGTNIGGNGTWEIGLRYPSRFAALVPVIGYHNWDVRSEVPENICDMKDVPVWAFHGANDTKIPIEAQQVLVEALKACGGTVKFTVFPNYGHDIEIPAYTEPGLYDWLFAQARD